MATYEAEFYWPTSANEVHMQGSWDSWKENIPLEKSESGFVAKVQVPCGQQIDYKFIVDGEWKINPDFPTTADWQGNINNYIITLPTPPTPKSQPKTIDEDEDEAPQTPVKPVEHLPSLTTDAAVTPMAVPSSSYAPVPDLDIDPTFGRNLIEAVVEAQKAQISDTNSEAVKLNEVRETVAKETPAETIPAPTATVEDVKVVPVVDVVTEKPVEANKEEAVALNSPIIKEAPKLEAVSEQITSVVPKTPERPGLGTPSSTKRATSTRSSKMFGFPGHSRKASQSSDTPGSSPPTTPGTEKRKKKSSFLAKVHDIFHPPKSPQAN